MNSQRAVDLLRQQCHASGKPEWYAEIASRRKRSSQPIPGDGEIMRRICVAIAYSQGARSAQISAESIAKSLGEFDSTVGRIEQCLAAEAKTGAVIASWEKNPDHEPTCEACDAKTFCPDFKLETEPRLPGYKI